MRDPESGRATCLRRAMHGWQAWGCLSMLGGWLFAGGCVTNAMGVVQRELEVLVAPEANPLLVRDSFLIDVFGPQILRLFH